VNGNIAALGVHHQAQHLQNPMLKAFQLFDSLDADGWGV